jgi:hypothetical protein
MTNCSRTEAQKRSSGAAGDAGKGAGIALAEPERGSHRAAADPPSSRTRSRRDSSVPMAALRVTTSV